MDATADTVSPAQPKGDEEGQVETFDVVKAALRLYDASYQRDEHNIIEGYDDLEVRAGNQWPADEEAKRKDDGRPCETVNQTGQFVRQVTGDMRQMRPAIKVVPVDDDATEEGADAIAGVIRYIENRSDAQAVYFQGADSQVACGMGAWRIITEYASATTFNQEVRIVPIDDALAVLWDEDSTLPTREDAMECLIPIDMARAKFEKQYPNASATDFAPTDLARGVRRWNTEDKVRVGEYWWKEPFERTLALMQDGTVKDLSDASEEELAKAAAEGARIEPRASHKVRRALVTATEIIEGPEDWPGSYIPIVPVIGEEVKIERKVVRHGVIRFLKPVQRIYNYAVSTDIEVTALQPKAPFTGTELNFKKYAQEWRDANRKNFAYLPYTPDPVNGGAAPQRVQPAVSSQGVNTTIQRAQQDMHSVTGIYPASLGAKSNETSGKAVLARQREGDTGTFVYPDNWTRSIRYTGKILVDLVPKIYDTARVLRIIGEDGKIEKIEINKVMGMEPDTGAMRIFNDVTSGAYDVSIQMGPSYATKREEARDGMQTFMQGNPNVAPLIGDLYAKAQDWPMAEEISERLELALPAPIRQMLAQKSGKPLPPEMQPPPPSPEQIAAAHAELAEKQAKARGAEASAREAEAKAQTAETQLERELMIPPGGAMPEIGAAMEGMARSIVELRLMMGGLLQSQRQPADPPAQPGGMAPPPPPDEPPEPLPVEPGPPPDQPPPGGFFASDIPTGEPVF